VHAR
jgi:hypothetical protein